MAHKAMDQNPGETKFQRGDFIAKTYYRYDVQGSNGPCIEIHAQLAPGEWKELVRYDCFDSKAHRHHFYASGKEDRIFMEIDGKPTEGIPAAVDYADRDLRGHVRDLAASFGFGDWAARISEADEKEAMETVLSAARADTERFLASRR